MNRSFFIRHGIRLNMHLVFVDGKSLKHDITNITDKYSNDFYSGRLDEIPRRHFFSSKNNNQLVQQKNCQFNVGNPFEFEMRFDKISFFEQSNRYCKGLAFNLQI